MNFYEFEKVINKLIERYSHEKEKKGLKNTVVECKINNLGNIKIYLKKEVNSRGKADFYVLYLVLVRDPNKRVDFDLYQYWEGDPNIEKIVKISVLKYSGAVIISKRYTPGCAYSNYETTDNVIVIDNIGENGILHVGGDFTKVVPLRDILSAIDSLSIDSFFNHFNVKRY